MQRNEEISVPLLTDVSAQTTEKKVWIKSPSGSFQAFLGFVGFGVIVLYVKSSQNCAADSRCIDQILAMLPQKYSTATLIICGGVEFALTSALCAIGAVPAFLKYIKKHPGIKTFVSGGGIIALAGAAAMETMLIVMKAFPSMREALQDIKPWISLISSYPLNLYGVTQFFSKDIPRVISKGSQWIGLYKGKSVRGNETYTQLREEYNLFRDRTANRFKMFVPKARYLQYTPNNNQKPLQFLYETQLEEINSNSWLKAINTKLFGSIGFAAAMGSITPVSVNTFYFLYHSLLPDEEKSTLSMVGVTLLSLLMGSPRIRTIMEKTVMGAINLADLNQHLHYQLNPKITIGSWIIGFITAYFSYAVLKDTTLRLVTGQHQQLLADIAGYSIEISHLILSLQFVNSLLTRLAKNGLYKVQEAVQEVCSMTLEEFDDFVKENDNQLDVYHIKKIYDGNHSNQEQNEVKQTVIPSVVVEDELNTNSSPKKQRWAPKLCSWWCKKEKPVSEEKNLQVRPSLI